MYECPLCKLTTRDFDELKAHIRQKHKMFLNTGIVKDYLHAMELKNKAKEKPIEKVIEEKEKCSVCGGTNIHYKDGCLDCVPEPEEKPKPVKKKRGRKKKKVK